MNFPVTAPEPGARAIDPIAIGRFAELVFGSCEGHVAIRKIREKGLPDAKPVATDTVCDDRLAGALCRDAQAAASDGRGLFVVPCTTRVRGNAKADNLFQTAVIPADLDAGDIEAMRTHLEHHLGQASLIVASGGLTEDSEQKLHLYWKLKQAAAGDDLQMVCQVREAIIDAVVADPAFRRLTQPIRVPGSVHGKNGVLTAVRILEDNAGVYDLSDLAKRAADMPPLPGHPTPSAPARAAAGGKPVTKLLIEQVREGGVDGITRFDAQTKVIGHWVRQARTGIVTLQEARSAVADHNVAMLQPPRPEWQVQRDFDAILLRDRHAHPAAWSSLVASAGHDLTAIGVSDLQAPERSEDALAAAFVDQHGRDWRHVAAWGAWYRWTGTLWVMDDTSAVFDLVRHVCREAAGSAESSEARKIASRRTMDAVVKIAATDPRVATGPAAWDRHDDLLNSPDAVIDLVTGEVMPHDPALLITQVTAVGSSGDCPLWRRFLGQVTGGDEEMQAYLARVCGYCLTGGTSEQVFFFFHGGGANGKSVFIQTLARVMGSYASTAPLDTFMVARQGAHPTDLAGLRGKRMVSVTETEPGRAWAESRIKTITGGDPISARFMHRDFFEFIPTFKLLVAGNHRPQLTGVGEAMRRRLHLIPFDVTIPPADRDKALPDKLGAELGGILAWMLAGLADWRCGGLQPPPSVLAASENYFADEDDVGQWITECCTTGRDHRASAKSLFASWSGWATAAGLPGGSQRTLGEALLQRGFTPARTNKGRFWIGIAPGPSAGEVKS